MHSFLEHIEERFGLYEGVHVPLEQPMIEIEEQELNKPKRSSGKKKYVVYVKDPKTGNVKKINFETGHLFPIVKLNFNVGLFSCIF